MEFGIDREQKTDDKFEPAPIVEVMAKKLIGKHHTHLANASITFLFRNGTWNSKNRETWGSAKAVTGDIQSITGLDFIITINKEVWTKLTESHREACEALIDHELQHCCRKDDGKGNDVYYIQGHDIEDFVSIIDRHGFWTPSLEYVEKNFLQTQLPLDEAVNH